MLHIRIILIFMVFLLTSFKICAQADDIALSVWTNEAIVATYTYNYQNFLSRQKEIAQYFTSTAWINYSNALQNSKLPQSVQTNHYTVTAVATMPPVIKSTGADQWHAVMPILVIYQNPQYQQKQTLEINIDFKKADEDMGVRGWVITQIHVKTKEPPCQCAAKTSSPSITIT